MSTAMFDMFETAACLPSYALCLSLYLKGWHCILPYSAQADPTTPPPSILRSPAVVRLMRMVGSRSADMGADLRAESSKDDGPVP